MRVLLVDGFETSNPIVDHARARLEASAHDVTVLNLVDAGFDRFMSAEERAAYHEADNLVTEETRASAELLRSHDALLVCGPMVCGAIAAHTKSWFERVFVPEVSFTFTESGRITAALTNITRVGMIVSCTDADPEPHRRQGSARSVLRGVRLNAARRCRSTYLALKPGEDAEALINQALSRW